MVDGPEVAAVLPGVVEAAARDLGELAGAVEARGSEGVGVGGVDAPVCKGGGVAGGVEGCGGVEEAFVVAVPGVVFYGEGVAGVGGTFVVAMDLEELLVMRMGLRRL